MLKKYLILLVFPLVLTIFVLSCNRGPSEEEKYEKSFQKMWNQLSTKQKKIDKWADEKGTDIKELIEISREGAKIHKDADKSLKQLNPPKGFKKFHQLTLRYLEAGASYYEETFKVADETRGNYTDAQTKKLEELQKKWQDAYNAVTQEAKKMGWQVK